MILELSTSIALSLLVLYQLPKYRDGFHGNMDKKYLVKHLCFSCAGAAFFMAMMLILMLFAIGESNGEVVFVNKDANDEYENTMAIPITLVIFYLFATIDRIWDMLFPNGEGRKNDN